MLHSPRSDETTPREHTGCTYRPRHVHVPSFLGQLTRAMEVDQRFADLSLGLVDASVVALAESLGICRYLIVAYFWRVLT